MNIYASTIFKKISPRRSIPIGSNGVNRGGSKKKAKNEEKRGFCGLKLKTGGASNYRIFDNRWMASTLLPADFATTL